jgi:hypothetical protein
MPKNNSTNKSPRRGRERRARIRGEVRKQPDLMKLSYTIQAMALAQAEKEAQAQADARKKASS